MENKGKIKKQKEGITQDIMSGNPDMNQKQVK